jgi:hypothetical protein
MTQFSTVVGFLDVWAEPGLPPAGLLQVQGWVVDPLGPPMAIVVTVDGSGVALARYGLARPDVEAAYPGLPGAATSGWSAPIAGADDLDDRAIVGAQVVRLTGETVSLGRATLRKVARPVAPPDDLVGFLDAWGDSGPLPPGRARVQGWVVDRRGPPFGVLLSIGGQPAAFARVGQSRPDVAAAHPDLPGAESSGWETSLTIQDGLDDRATVVAQVVRADGAVVPYSQAPLRQVARSWADPRAQVHWTELPGWFLWRSAQEEAARHFSAGSRFVEVGNYLGRSLCSLGEVVQQSGKRFTVIGIATCRGSGPEGPDQKDYHRAVVEQGGGTFAGALHKNVLDCGYGDTISLIVSDSLTAAGLFGDASLDWVHLDARHDYASLKADIQAWLPKVKPGGWLSGDDYDEAKWPDAVRAVGESLPGAQPWSVQQWRWIVE